MSNGEEEQVDPTETEAVDVEEAGPSRRSFSSVVAEVRAGYCWLTSSEIAKELRGDWPWLDAVMGQKIQRKARSPITDDALLIAFGFRPRFKDDTPRINAAECVVIRLADAGWFHGDHEALLATACAYVSTYGYPTPNNAHRVFLGSMIQGAPTGLFRGTEGPKAA